MSAMTFGPPVVLDGPLPVAPRHSLLKTPGVLQPPADEHWMNGHALWGYPEEVPDTWDPCSTGTFADKNDESTIPTPDFAAFAAYIPVTCSSFTLASNPQHFADKAEAALAARISYAVEAALSRGIPMSANPFLADAAVDIVVAGAQSAETGIAYLEEAIGQTAQQGMIHMTPGAASVFFDNWGALLDDIYTPLGTPVAIGGGYVGATPSGQGAAAAGQSWVYATGQVRAWLASEFITNIKDVLDRSDNVVTFRAERYVLVEWDTALQAAVLIDWSP